MDKSILLKLVKAACFLTLCLFFLDRHEFQGDYLVAAMEFVLMSLIISFFFAIVYSVILLFRRLVKIYG